MSLKFFRSTVGQETLLIANSIKPGNQGKSPFSTNLKAGAYLVLSMAGFTINDALIKSLGHKYNVGQILTVRGLFLCAFLVILLKFYRRRVMVFELLNRSSVLRALADVATTFCFLTALRYVPFANLLAVLQVLPLVVTLGAAWFFHETVGWRRYLAIGIGFIGVLIIVQPGTEHFDGYSMLAVVVVIFAAARDLLTRSISRNVPSLVITFVTAIVVTLAGMIAIVPLGGWRSMNTMDIGILALAAAFLFIGYHGIVLAMRTGEISAIAPLRYTGLVMAIFVGMIFFDEFPSFSMMAGAALVVATGLYSVHRERVTISNRQS